MDDRDPWHARALELFMTGHYDTNTARLIAVDEHRNTPEQLGLNTASSAPPTLEGPVANVDAHLSQRDPPLTSQGSVDATPSFLTARVRMVGFDRGRSDTINE